VRPVAAGVRLIPMTDDRVETHVAVEVDGERKVIHFQEYWVRLRASVAAEAVVPVGAEQAKPAPGVLEAIADADVILFPPSNPVVSVGTILAVPGIREAIAEAGVPVIGLSPIVGDAPVRGMADKVLAAVGVESTATAVAEHYGSGLLDGWLVDTVDAAAVAEVEAAGIRCRAVPLMMTDTEATARMAREALALAEEVRAV
jgi:LPPG:FO 2-phospho-L-lactate transferase